jgi:uncharacterized protein YrrD
MLNIVRRSQLLGLTVIDSSTASYLGEVEEIWLDESGRVVYFSGPEGFLPLEQVASVGTQAISTYGKLPLICITPISWLCNQFEGNLLAGLKICSSIGKPEKLRPIF